MKYTVVDLLENFIPEGLFEQIPDGSTVVGVMGIDLEYHAVHVILIEGVPQATLDSMYDGLKPLPSDAKKLDVVYSGENYNACWYVEGKMQAAKEVKTEELYP